MERRLNQSCPRRRAVLSRGLAWHALGACPPDPRHACRVVPQGKPQFPPPPGNCLGEMWGGGFPSARPLPGPASICRPLITVWLEVRVLPGPPRSPMRTGVSWSLKNSPQNAGVSAVQIPGVRSLPPAEVAIASILAPGLWARQTRFLAPSPVAHEDRQDQIGQAEHRVLARPLSRSVAQTGDADAARQSSFDGSLHQFGREEGKRDRHVDLSNAAFVACSDLLDTGDGAGNDLIKPTPATRDGGNEVTRVSARIGRRSPEARTPAR